MPRLVKVRSKLYPTPWYLKPNALTTRPVIWFLLCFNVIKWWRLVELQFTLCTWLALLQSVKSKDSYSNDFILQGFWFPALPVYWCLQCLAIWYIRTSHHALSLPILCCHPFHGSRLPRYGCASELEVSEFNPSRSLFGVFQLCYKTNSQGIVDFSVSLKLTS